MTSEQSWFVVRRVTRDLWMIAEPGQTIPPFKLTLKPGHYKLVDTVADHVDLGEYGTLIVVK